MIYSVEFAKPQDAGTPGLLAPSLSAPAAVARSVVKACMALATLQLMTACAARAPVVNEKSRQAEVLFRQHCITSGEKIKRTVKDVEGIFLLKARPEKLNYGDQFLMDDPYGRDLGGDAYIGSFLKANHELPRRNRASVEELPARRETDLIGYDYVEIANGQDGVRSRFTAYIDQPGKRDPSYRFDALRVVLQKAPAPDTAPRYGVTYEDISTPEDRAVWIAGSLLKVIDLETDEVIAERIGYMIDRGQGSTAGGRSPWLLAASTACPAFPDPHARQANQTVRFVEKVLIPTRRAGTLP